MLGDSPFLDDLPVKDEPEDWPDFNPLYRAIDAANTLSRERSDSGLIDKPVWLQGKEPPDPRAFGLDLASIKRELHKLIKTIDEGMTVCLVELSLFHPDDASGREFFSFIAGQVPQVKRYIGQVAENLKDSRQPIVPSRNLYRSCYYVKPPTPLVRSCPSLDLDTCRNSDDPVLCR